MNSKIGPETFTRTRSTWLTLAGAGFLWVVICVWAFSAVEFETSGDSPNASPQAAQARESARLARVEAEEKVRLEAQAAAADQRHKATEAEAAKLARLSLEAEEQARLEAQGMAAERRIAAAQVTEMAALKAKGLAEEKARQAAEAQAKQQAEAEAAEEARAAEQAEAAEQARAAEQERVRAEVIAQARKNSVIDKQARQAAAAEASRIAALSRQRRSLTSNRAQELGVLDELSSRLRFAAGSATVSRQTERILDDIFNPLYLYSDVSIQVAMATNEYDGTTKDGLLSRDRGRAIASYLINRGLEKERFRIYIESGEDLSAGTHRVRVSAEEVR